MEAVWHEVWWAVRADFSDLPGIVAVTQLVLRMLDQRAHLCKNLRFE